MHDPLVAKVLNPEEWFSLANTIKAFDITTAAVVVGLAFIVAGICYAAHRRVFGSDDE